MPDLKLYYFNIAGKAEGIRLAATVGEVPFEDVRMTREEFMTMKTNGTLMYGQVPALSVNGKILVQSAAIIRYIGKLSKNNLYPSDLVEAAVVDSIVDQEIDMFAALTCSKYQSRFGYEEALGGKDGEGTKKVRKMLNDVILPKHLGFFETLLEKSTGWLAGGEGPSIADFVLVPRLEWLMGNSIDGIESNILDQFPKLQALIQKLHDLPAVKAYYEARSVEEASPKKKQKVN